MYDIYIDVESIIPIEEKRGRVDLKYRIKPEGQWNPVATFEVSTFFDLSDKTIEQIVEEAKKQAQIFADVLAKAENFKVDE